MSMLEVSANRSIMTTEELKELNKKQFNLVEILRSQGKVLEADQVERIAIIINRNLVLGLSSFEIPTINLSEKITNSIKIYRIDPGLLGGQTTQIIIKNYTSHRITFKSSSIQSGNFTTSPSGLIPSSGLTRDGICISLTASDAKAAILQRTGIPLLVGSECTAASISLSLQTQTGSYTVALGAISMYFPYSHRAGIEIKSGEIRVGSDRQTLNGVDISGVVSNVSDLCRHTHSVESKEYDYFYEDVTSSNPQEGFTVMCYFKNNPLMPVAFLATNLEFYFEFHPLNSDGSFYRR